MLKLIFLIVLIHPAAFEETKADNSLVYGNLSSFFDGGWLAPGGAQGWGYGTAFDKPSSVKRELLPLDASSSNGVWSGTPTGSAMFFTFCYPEFLCNYTQINVTIKYYHSTSLGGAHFRPCQSADSITPDTCDLQPSQTMAWQTRTLMVNLTSQYHQQYNWSFLEFSGNKPGDVLLLDEVRISHDGFQCTGSRPNATYYC